jgi:hypothetical protein
MTYRCHFCGDELRQDRLNAQEVVLAVAGVRSHYCPHCFEKSVLPVTWLKVLVWPLYAVRQIVRWILGAD